MAHRPQVGAHPPGGEGLRRRAAHARAQARGLGLPNSAGVVIDAVRLIKLALNNGIAGQLDGPSSYLMKSPHTQRPDQDARMLTEEFIVAHSRPRRREGRRAAAGEVAAEACRLPAESQRWLARARLRAGPSCHAARHSVGICSGVPSRSDRLRIAQVTPLAWGQRHEINEFASRRRVSCRRVDTRSWSPPRRASAVGRARRAADRRRARASRRAVQRLMAGRARGRRRPASARVGTGLRCPTGPRARGVPLPLDVSKGLDALLAGSISTSFTSTIRSHRAPPRSPFATRARSTLEAFTSPRNACSRRRSRDRWWRSSSAV